MSKVIELFPQQDIEYITGGHNEPDIVGVKTESCSIQYAPDLHDVLVGDFWISRDALIAFIFVTDIWQDIKKVLDEGKQ